MIERSSSVIIRLDFINTDRLTITSFECVSGNKQVHDKICNAISVKWHMRQNLIG